MTSARPERLGVLDWGIGGLDVLRALRASGDTRPVLYISDAGCTPYGKLSTERLAIRIAELLRWMRAQGCTSVVVGCNAASTVLHAAVVRAASEGLSVRGVIDVAVDAALREGTDQILIIGGERTIRSRCHLNALERRASRPLHIVTRVAQPLSALVEAGVLDGPELTRCLAHIFAGLSATTTTLISACTHYVAVEQAMRGFLPQLQVFIDPARRLAAAMPPRAAPGDTTRADRFVTTGNAEASRRAAQLAFGIDAPFEVATVAPDGPPPPRAGG